MNFITKLHAISQRKALVIYLVEIKFPENKLSSSILYQTPINDEDGRKITTTFTAESFW